MLRVARASITKGDGFIKKCALDDEETIEDVVKSLKDDFEGWIKQWASHLSADVEFIEWEDFCPKCECTSLDMIMRDHPNPGDPGGLMNRCDDCGYEFPKDVVNI